MSDGPHQVFEDGRRRTLLDLCHWKVLRCDDDTPQHILAGRRDETILALLTGHGPPVCAVKYVTQRPGLSAWAHHAISVPPPISRRRLRPVGDGPERYLLPKCSLLAQMHLLKRLESGPAELRIGVPIALEGMVRSLWACCEKSCKQNRDQRRIDRTIAIEDREQVRPHEVYIFWPEVRLTRG